MSRARVAKGGHPRDKSTGVGGWENFFFSCGMPARAAIPRKRDRKNPKLSWGCPLCPRGRGPRLRLSVRIVAFVHRPRGSGLHERQDVQSVPVRELILSFVPAFVRVFGGVHRSVRTAVLTVVEQRRSQT